MCYNPLWPLCLLLVLCGCCGGAKSELQEQYLGSSVLLQKPSAAQFLLLSPA